MIKFIHLVLTINNASFTGRIERILYSKGVVNNFKGHYNTLDSGFNTPRHPRPIDSLVKAYKEKQ